MRHVLGGEIFMQGDGETVELVTLSDRLRSLDREPEPEVVRQRAACRLDWVRRWLREAKSDFYPGVFPLLEALEFKYTVQILDEESREYTRVFADIVELLFGKAPEGSFRGADLLDDARLFFEVLPQWGLRPSEATERFRAELQETTPRFRGPIPDESHQCKCDECGKKTQPGAASEEEATEIARWARWLVGDRDLCPECCLVQAVTPPPPLSQEFLAAPVMGFTVEAYQGVRYHILPEEFAGWVAAVVSPADRLEILTLAEDAWFSRRGGYAMEVLTALAKIPATGPSRSLDKALEAPATESDDGQDEKNDDERESSLPVDYSGHQGAQGDQGFTGPTPEPPPRRTDPGQTTLGWVTGLLIAAVFVLSGVAFELWVDLDMAQNSIAIHNRGDFEERGSIRELDCDRRGNTFRCSGEVNNTNQGPRPVRYFCDKNSCHFECEK